jgi:hypothetical protein
VQAHVSSQFLEDHLFVLQPVASGQQQLSPRVIHLALQVCISRTGQETPAAVAGMLDTHGRLDAWRMLTLSVVVR